MIKKEVFDFLLKETPEEGGCMLCLVTYKFKTYSLKEQKNVIEDRKEYFLIEKHNISNGVMFTINGRFFYDYDFVWEDGNENHWEILYKNNVK